MASVIPERPAQLDAPHGFVFEGVSWDDYEAMLRIVGERPIRVTYDRGRMQVMSPLWSHGGPSFLLGTMISLLVEELDIPYEPADSVTFRRRDLEKGAEPDKCFYFRENASRVRGKREITLPDDPPPDMVVEVDVTADSLERLPIYAALGIREVWRLSKRGLEFLVLQHDSTYQPSENSLAFPTLSIAAADRFLRDGLDAEKTAWTRRFRSFVRENLTP